MIRTACRIKMRLMFNLRMIGIVVGAIALPWITSGATAESLEIRVMTFNVRYGTADDGPDHWDKRKDLVFETLRQSGADMIGLQEALRFQLDQIEQAVGGYAEIGEGREGGTKDEYSAILMTRDLYRDRRSLRSQFVAKRPAFGHIFDIQSLICRGIVSAVGRGP